MAAGPRVWLLTWAAGGGLARRLAHAGCAVDDSALDAAALKRIGRNPPDAVLIDLSRRPSAGRDLGVWLRKRRSTRHVVLLFLGGSESNIAKVKAVLPDACYCDADDAVKRLASALASPPVVPVVPQSALAGYSGTPLAKKLGVKPGQRLLILNPPADLITRLGELPQGVRILRSPAAHADLTLWFARSRSALQRGIRSRARRIGRDGLWIAWPKKASALVSDLDQSMVRATGLAAGLVDYKIAAIDATWSGLKFARRRP